MLSKKQRELDEKKWKDSMENGGDMCGWYDYCAYCDKKVENPCEKALKKSKKVNKTSSKETIKVDGKSYQFRSTILEP